MLQDFLVQFEGVLDFGYIFEMTRIWYSETLHSVGVAPFLEMLLKGAATPVACPAANLALELLAQAMQLIQPVRNRLSIPTHRQTFRVVLRIVVVV